MTDERVNNVGFRVGHLYTDVIDAGKTEFWPRVVVEIVRIRDHGMTLDAIPIAVLIGDDVLDVSEDQQKPRTLALFRAENGKEVAKDHWLSFVSTNEVETVHSVTSDGFPIITGYKDVTA